jgi:D-amino-acid oxidase
VTVVGAGIIGLTTAIRLLDAGHEVEVLTADPIEATTSWLAAAVWFPTHAGPADRVARWSAATYDELTEQAELGVPGVVRRESLALYRDPPGHPPWTAAVHLVRPAGPEDLPPGYPHGLRFSVPSVKMPRYLPWLVDAVRLHGGQLAHRRVTSLAALTRDADVVVNCSGLAARELAGDAAVHPVRGQIVLVRNPGLTMSVRDEGHPDGRAYVHPRSRDVVLGGTLDENEWSTEPDPATAAAIIRRCTEIVPRLAGSPVLRHVVGLRPGRREVRLEVDPATPRLVHNYGHGGSGITVGWGCATEVAALVGQL